MLFRHFHWVSGNDSKSKLCPPFVVEFTSSQLKRKRPVQLTRYVRFQKPVCRQTSSWSRETRSTKVARVSPPYNSFWKLRLRPEIPSLELRALRKFQNVRSRFKTEILFVFVLVTAIANFRYDIGCICSTDDGCACSC